MPVIGCRCGQKTEDKPWRWHKAWIKQHNETCNGGGAVVRFLNPETGQETGVVKTIKQDGAINGLWRPTR